MKLKIHRHEEISKVIKAGDIVIFWKLNIEDKVYFSTFRKLETAQKVYKDMVRENDRTIQVRFYVNKNYSENYMCHMEPITNNIITQTCVA